MVVKVGDCILSPLGCGTLVNYEAAEKGQTSLKRYKHKWGLPEAFVASFFDEDMLSTVCAEVGIGDDYTRFERMAIVVTAKALAETDIDAASSDTMFILASTKGNVHLLSSDTECDVERLSLSVAADKIAGWFGNHRKPLVVSNACISGLHAQIEAMRILQAKRAKTVIVIAADMLSPFIVSGFQAFKTVSDELCRPFDEERLGLNLGEAAACVLYQLKTESEINASDWIVRTGAVFNDAFHISHPSKTAEGSWRALTKTIQGIPSSSSHTLIGGFAGAAIAASGFGAIHSAVIIKIIAFIFLAPIIGMILAFFFTLGVLYLCRKANPHKAEHWFKRMQLVSSALFSVGHGLNDSQKVMGIIAAAMIAAHPLGIGMGVESVKDIPDWVAFSCFTVISLGTISGGWKIVKTMGTKITKVTPLEGMVAETAGAFTLYLTEFLKIPVSTTHTITGAIIGVGATKRLSAVRWGVTKNLMVAWILTIPVSALLAAGVFYLASLIGN